MSAAAGGGGADKRQSGEVNDTTGSFTQQRDRRRGEAATTPGVSSRRMRFRRGLVAVLAATLVGLGAPLVPFPGGPPRAWAADSYAGEVLADNPISYWELQETSGSSAVDTKGATNGVIVGTPVLGQPGPWSGARAYRFKGGCDGVNLTAGASRFALQAFSLELWFTAPALSPAGTMFRWHNYGYQLDSASDGKVWFSAYVNGGASVVSVGSGSAVLDGKWHHLVVTVNSTAMSMYVDGTLASSSAMGSPVHYGVDNWTTIARDVPGCGGNPPYEGSMAHVAFYNSVLSPPRLRAHYSASGRTVAVPAAQTRGQGRHGPRTTTRRADPVDTATGASVNEVTDLAVPGKGIPFAFIRTYNSNDSTVGPLGRGWTHGWAASLSVGGTGAVTVRTEDGAELVYTPSAAGGFDRPAGITSILASVTGGYDLTRADQVRYRFDPAGRLQSVKDRSSQGVTLGYDASNRLVTAADAAARVFTFSYNGAGKLATVSAPAGDGRSVSFAYAGDLLTSVTDVRGGVTAYAYDASGRLSQITDPEGKLEVRNTYNASGQVTQQLDPLGNATTFAWDAAAQRSTMTDPKSKTWVDVYSGNVLVSSTEPSGTSSVRFDGDLNPAGGTDARGNTWSATYDSRGNLLTRTAPAPFSYAESWTYDAANNPLTHTDGRANTTTYAYDASGRLTSTTWPGGASETRTYTASGQPASVTDARSNTTTYAYDDAGNLTSVTTPAGSVTSWTYDAAGRPLTRTEPRGNAAGATPAHYTTTWTYDAAGNVLTETDALGRTSTSTYDGNGRVVSRTDPAGRVTSYAYNDAGELITETAPGGLVTTNEYDSRGQLVKVTSPSGAVTTYTYDDAGRVASMVEPRGNVAGATPADYRWSYGYDGNGNQTTVTDPLGRTTTRAYDALNRLTAVTDPNGHVATYGYDASSNRTSQANHLGHTTTWAYDARNRMASMTNPVGKTWTYGYDANGNRTSETTPLGSITTRSYDADNRLTAVVDPLGNAPGGVPAAHRTTYGYDPDGNRTTETDPLGATTTFAYDRVGNQTGRTDANGHTTTWGFDALNRLASVAAPASGTTAYAYDVPGNLTTRTDANGHVTTYGYDADHRLTSLTSPTGQRWTYTYDAAGRRTTTVDAKANAAGNPALGTTTLTYDRVGRLVGVDHSDGTPDVTYGYDAAGRRTVMIDGAGLETRTYDAADRLTDVIRGGIEWFAYGYDAAGRLTSRTYPDGTLSTLGYDHDGRLVGVTGPEGTTAYAYDAAGRLVTTTLPNGIVETRSWDDAQRLASITDTRAGTTVASFAYTRDAVGNPTQVVAATGTQTYGYDAADRLTSVCYAASCARGSLDLTTWTYDQVGNWLTETTGAVTRSYSYNAADQLTQSSLAGATTTYGYDGNGNQTAAGLTTFTYDLAGRMTSVLDPGGAVIQAYSYDGDGKRLRTTTPLGATGVTNSAWDITLPVPEVAVESDAAGLVTRRYGYGLDRISTTAGGAASFYLHDALGSVAKVTSSTGAGQWTYDYKPFGQPRITTHDDLTAPEQPMRFTGEELDATGLYHLRARQYDPATGRFTATDPLAPEIADPYVSAYVYADDRPTVLTDPTGEKGRKVGVVGGFVGAPKIAPPRIGWTAIGGAIGWKAGRALRERVDSPRKFRQAVANGRKTDGCDAHHIVAVKDRRAARSRVILSEAGISVHDPRNGALINRYGHQRLHTNDYHDMVTARLRSAIPNVDFALGRLQFEIETQYPCPQ